MASHIERNVTREFQLKLKNENMLCFIEPLPEIDYIDPLEKLINSGKTEGSEN
jgi:hypothetical protein